MPYITGSKEQEDGQTFTSYSGFVDSSPRPYQYKTAQDIVRIVNRGSRDITVTIGGTNTVVAANKEYTFMGPITQFTVSTQFGFQAFVAESWIKPGSSSGGGGNGSGVLIVANVTELQTSYPNGAAAPVWVTSENSWYYWSGSAPAPDTTPPTVTASLNSGTYLGTQSVTLAANESATIYYTTNGSTPNTGSAVYSSAISISASTVLKYYGVDAAGNSSAVQTATYTITQPDTTPPDAPTNFAAGTPTSSTVPLTWTASVASDLSKYEIAYSTDGTNFTVASSNVTGTSATVTGLTANTAYTFRITAIDTSSNRSTAVTTTAKTAAVVDVSPMFLQMNGTSDYIQAPPLTFDEIQMDISPDFVASKMDYYFDARTGSTAYIANNASGVESFTGIANAYYDGVLLTASVSNLTSNKRTTLKATFTTALTDNVTFFASNALADFMKGKIYRIKILLAGSVVASYNFTQQFSGTVVPDDSGNGNTATLTGGTWVADTPQSISTPTSYFITLDGVDDKINVPVPAGAKYMDLKLSREGNDIEGYVFDMRNSNGIYSGSAAGAAVGYNGFTVDGVAKTVGVANASTDLTSGVVLTARYTMTSVTKAGNMTVGSRYTATGATDWHTLRIYAIKFYDNSMNIIESFDFTTGTGSTLYGTSGMRGTIIGGQWIAA